MAEDVNGLLARINQPNLRYETFADPADGADVQVTATEAGSGASGLLRKYCASPTKPAPVAAPASRATPLKPLFARYAAMMARRVERRRA